MGESMDGDCNENGMFMQFHGCSVRGPWVTILGKFRVGPEVLAMRSAPGGGSCTRVCAAMGGHEVSGCDTWT